MQKAYRTASRAVVAALINASEGTFFGAQYIRKDGTETRINGRLGCSLKTKAGSPSREAARDRETFVVYDVKREGYRSLSLDRLVRISIRGCVFQVSN